MLKRSFDLFLAALLILLLFPVLLCIALAIRLTSPGPALYRQIRTGRNLVLFRIVKFRTMQTGSEGPAYALAEDPRVTRLGRWLRRTKLDELPQLWNVLCGEMSFVGPRPIVPELTWSNLRDYTELFAARPGLTDPASIKYADEAQRLEHVEDPQRYFLEVMTQDKLQLSRDYQQRATLGSDLILIGRTLQVCQRALVAELRNGSLAWNRQREHASHRGTGFGGGGYGATSQSVAAVLAAEHTH